MSSVITDENKINELLNRRLENVFPSKEEAAKKLKEGKPLKIYLGIDPTGTQIHLGHTIPLLFLKQLHELGHQIVLLIGDFTARIGDPTDKTATRKVLTEKEIKDNMRTYLDQVHKILSKGSFEVKYNSQWLAKMKVEDLMNLTSKVTVPHMLDRDMFKIRLYGEWMCNNTNKKFPGFSTLKIQKQDKDDEGRDTAVIYIGYFICPQCGMKVTKEEVNKGTHSILIIPTDSSTVHLNEFLYPLMQGYDSVEMQVDGEVGGNDQTFNMLVGRDLEKEMLGKDKLVFATRLLADAKSGKKMSKTEGGFIAVDDSPKDIFEKISNTIPDEMTKTAFELCTEVELEKIDWSKNPQELKEDLAYELVKMYHGEKEAEKAKNDWRKEDELQGEGVRLVEFVAKANDISMSAAKDLFTQKAVEINRQTATDWNLEVKKGDLIKIGKKRPVKAI